MSLYGAADDQTEARRFKCGRQLPGAAVGQPMVAVVECQNRQFEILCGQREADTLTPVVTCCVVCRGQDHLRLLCTNASGGDPPLFAGQVPALFCGHPMPCPHHQQHANPAMLVCRQCGQFRFMLLDDGNEIKRRCVYCNDTRHLGYETRANAKVQRKFVPDTPANTP